GMGAVTPVAHDLDQVSHHRGGTRVAASAAPVEHELADLRALDEHGVEAVAHRRERVVRRDHRRVHAHRHLVLVTLGDGQQLHDVPELPGAGDVLGRHIEDALAVDVAGDKGNVEGDGGQDGGLGGGVVP